MSIASVREARVSQPPFPAGAPVSFDSLKSLVRGLNHEQRRAVTHRGGPLLVVAGPGTGKTEVVTRRVAWLIAAKLARPREILALTFTDNAAQELQARVDALVPYGQADAAIHTFHAFGDRLLREHAFELGLAGDVRLISRADAIIVMREHLFKLGLERYLPLGDPTRFIGALVDLFGRAKEESVSPADFQAHADGLLAGLAGDVEPDPVVADVAAARAELARAYAGYSDLLSRRGLIDHADQVSLPLRLLNERPQIRAAIHDRFRFVLVDELQDANASQVDFVLALTGSHRNITVVGDVDQGIYRFRGAVSGNIERFATALPGTRRVVLRRNYRSRAPIIEASRRLIGHNPGRADDPARQVAHRRSRRSAPVRVRTFRTAEDEADGIAQQIANRVAEGEPASDFAVLARSNYEADQVLRSLRVRGVPADNGARPELLALPAVRALLAFLRVVADTTNNLELYTLAASEPYSLSGEDLNPRLNASRRRQRSLWQTLIELADDPTEAGRRAARLIEHVKAGVAMSAGHATGEVLYDYLRRSGLLVRLARLDATGPDVAGLRGIARFVGLVRARASLLAHDRIALLVPHLERLADANQDIDWNASDPADDHVAVLTVHRAKGLEFKVVFVAGLVDGRFPVRGRPPLLSLPAELDRHADEEDGLAEERRLFYVAMTRARDELWLSHHTLAAGGRIRRRPSPFLAEALDAGAAVSPPPVAGTGPNDVELIGRLLQPAPAPPTPAARDRTSLSLSFSQVDEYLGCPERYRLRYVVGLSTPAHHALAYGSALHQTIAAFHVRQGQGEVMSEVELLAEFARNWTPEGFLSREHEEARYGAGQDALRRFRTQQLATGATPIAIERPFRFRLGPDQIVGRIDRLDQSAAGAVITDYKSSDVREQRRADTRARDSLQLQVYALAHQAETGELPARVQLHFLDSGVVGSAVPDASRLSRARETLSTAAEGIRAANFVPKPSPVACGYCPFREICSASAA